MKPHPHRNSIQTPPPILPTCTSTRRFSIASIGTIPAILESIHTNATLFTQQLLLANVDAQTNRAPHSPSPKDILALPLDAEFASALLKAIRKAAGSNTDAYDDYFAQLREQELPSFVTAHACCGTVEGPAALRKREYFDFIAYIACRSLIMATPRDTQLSTDDAWQSDQLSEIQRAVGDAIMRHILDEIDVSDASASAISPLKPIENDALLSASPELDSIRGGVKALLQYFRRKGFISTFGIATFGSSNDEDISQSSWQQGDPATLKYYITIPADIATASSVPTEQGEVPFSLIGLTLAAYLRRCGVDAQELHRVPFGESDPSLLSEEWKVVRVKPLPSSSTVLQGLKGLFRVR